MTDVTVEKSIVVADMARYSDVARELVEAIGPDADAGLKRQIWKLFESAMHSANFELEKTPFQFTGDGGIFLFDRAVDAFDFAKQLQREADSYSRLHSGSLAQRHFRVGICTDDVSFSGSAQATGYGVEFAGLGIAKAKRLEGRCRTGEVLICEHTWAGLPRRVRERFGERETVDGKRDERFYVYRRRIVDPDPNEPADLPPSTDTDTKLATTQTPREEKPFATTDELEGILSHGIPTRGAFDHIFDDHPESASRQLPDNIVHPAFGEVNVRRTGDRLAVNFTFLLKPESGEGWQTGVALDASDSMRGAYGTLLDPTSIPEDVLEILRQEGAIKRSAGDSIHRVHLRSRGLSRLKEMDVPLQYTKNVVEPLAREFIAYLASELDEDGGTTVAYWACGESGREYEIVGDFTAEECRRLELAGPQQASFGKGTCLTPIVRYFVDRFHDAEHGMYIFLTDGRLDDMNELLEYTTQLARRIEEGQRNPVKCVLVGLGNKIDVEQMRELDDLDTGTSVDIWDHKIAREMRSILKIFAEVADENRVVAPQATIYGPDGKPVVEFENGLPALVKFDMSAANEWFELVVGDKRIRQTVIEKDEAP